MSLDSGCGESYSEQGVMENAGFLDYRMPVALDLPMIEPLVVEVPNPKHPYGVRRRRRERHRGGGGQRLVAGLPDGRCHPRRSLDATST